MWFDPTAISKIAMPPVATLATSATSQSKSNAEYPKVAEIAKVATRHDSKIAPLHDLGMESIAEPGAIAATPVEQMRRQLPKPSEIDKRSMRALAMLDKCTALRAIFNTVVGDEVILTVAIRGLGTCELSIPKTKFDPWRLLELVERHGAATH